jgi:serine/threonine-protein kinase
MDVGMLLAGRYRLDQPIGAGGMGQVWAAHDTVLGRDVAIKAQKFDADRDRTAFDRFYREAQSTAGLQHPNVVTIFDSGTQWETAFLVMELLPGPNLETYVAGRGPLPERQVVALAAQIASGLASAHRAGVVHRDIKPANLVFDARGMLKIVDFGIARLAQTAAARLTATNTVIGSAPYLSPEQIEGRAADGRSDLYALGCVMMTMLTGRPPFEGEHPLAVMHQHVSVAPPHIGDRRPGIDPALQELVAEMLSKPPQGRPGSAQEVCDRLRHLQLSSPVERPEASWAATAVMAQPTRPLPAPTVHMTARATRDRLGAGRTQWIVGAVIVLAVAALAVIAIGTTASDPPSNQAAQSDTAATPSAKPSREPTSAKPSRKASAPQMTRTTNPRTPARSVQGALSDLRASVRAVSSSGQIEEKRAEELEKRVDELAKHFTEKEGKDVGKHVEDLDKYLYELSKKGELTQEGERRIAGPLQRLRELAEE